MSQTQDQMRPQKVVSCAPAHITETEFAHDQHWEHSALSRIIFTIAVSSLARAQKMDTQSVALAHHTTGVSTCPTLRGAKHTFPTLIIFYMLGGYTVSTYFYYTKAILMRHKHRNNLQTTTLFGLHHTGALNNWGKMKICKKHQTFEAIE